MARRLFNGRKFSENGWPYVDQGSCRWVKIAANASIQIQDGVPAAVMGAFARDYDAYIEPIYDADSACWTPGNSVATSNHPGGTAMDLRWQSHPFHVKDTFNAAQQATINELLDWYEDMIFWGGHWKSPIDEMHWQMGPSTYDTVNDRPFPKCQDFINRKIRADGFSTFRRGNAPVPPPPLSKADQYALAVLAEGQRRSITARGIQIAFATVFVESGWKMYANSKVPESMGIPHDAVGSDHDSVGLFQQRCPMWGPAAVLMDPAKSAGLFYDRLVKLDYNNPNRSPGLFAADVQRPAAQYRGRYDERFGDAIALYNRLATTAPPTQGDDDLSAEAERKIDVIYRELTQRLPSRSPLRHLGEGVVDTLAGMVLNTDGSQHVEIVKLLASLGHPPSLALLREVANADPVQYPDRQDDRLIAQAILAEVTATPPASVVNNTNNMPAAPAAVPQVVYVDRPAPAAEVAPVAPERNGNGQESTGQIIGAAYDALQKLRLADALPIEDRAPLAALISVLQTKNGSDL